MDRKFPIRVNVTEKSHNVIRQLATIRKCDAQDVVESFITALADFIEKELQDNNKVK